MQTVGYAGEQLLFVVTAGCVFCTVGTDVCLGDGTLVGTGEGMIVGFGEGALVGLGEGVLTVILFSGVSSVAARPNTCSGIGVCASTVGAASVTFLAAGFAVTPKVINDAIVRKIKNMPSCFLETPGLNLLNNEGLINPKTSNTGLKRKITNATLSIADTFYHFPCFIVPMFRVYFGYMGGISAYFKPTCKKCKTTQHVVLISNLGNIYHCNLCRTRVTLSEVEKRVLKKG